LCLPHLIFWLTWHPNIYNNYSNHYLYQLSDYNNKRNTSLFVLTKCQTITIINSIRPNRLTIFSQQNYLITSNNNLESVEIPVNYIFLNFSESILIRWTVLYFYQIILELSIFLPKNTKPVFQVRNISLFPIPRVVLGKVSMKFVFLNKYYLNFIFDKNGAVLFLLEPFQIKFGWTVTGALHS